MQIFIIIIAVIAILTFLAVITGILLHDIQTIKMVRDFNRHPYARRWRSRPLISILLPRTASDTVVEHIRKNKYRKKEILNHGDNPAGDIIVSFPNDTYIEQTTLSTIVKQLNYKPEKPQVEIIPIITRPKTLCHYFRTYHTIAASLFVKSRAGLGIQLSSPLFPIARQYNVSNRRIDIVYIIGRWIIWGSNLFVLASLCFLATQYHQPEYLLLYLAAFCVWLILAIWSYPGLSVKQKLLYITFAPASFAYFAIRAIIPGAIIKI